MTCSSINAALVSAPAGTYILIPSGSSTLSNCQVAMFAANGGGTGTGGSGGNGGVTLRGSGAEATKLILTGTSIIQWGQAWGTGGPVAWTSGFSQGATSITATGTIGSLGAGAIVFLEQCDTGYSGTPCPSPSGTNYDNGGLYVCGDNALCQTNSGQTGAQQHQQQTVFVTSVSGGGPYTVNFTPGLYLPNWALGNSPTLNWTPSNSRGSSVTTNGIGLEDMTVDGTGVTSGNILFFNLTYASWIKGVRVVGLGTNNAVGMTYTKNCLFANNYLFADNTSSADGIDMQEGQDSDDLVINNILTGGVPWEGTGSTEGNVFAYNYARDAHTIYYENMPFQHNAGSAFMLYEGNQVGKFDEDETHGTHDLNTWFRNYISGWDSPYQTVTPFGTQWDAFSRFENSIGNAIGNSSATAALTNYQSVQTSCPSDFVHKFSCSTQNDSLVQSTSMRWGNCDTVTDTCRFQSSEVPTSITPNSNCTASGIPYACCTGSGTGTCSASAWQNSVPSSDNLPCSFFLAGYSSTTCTPTYSGGTGLSWWKVCTSWATFPTSCSGAQIQPFPIAGPDITSGPYVNGTAYDNPASVAFANLPVDITYQNSYNITGSSYASGTETLTVSGLPSGSIHIMGPMQISGGNCGTGSEEVYITASTSTTVSYALASNPGSCTGTMLFPDVRQFDERVYENDPSGDPPPQAPSGLQAVVQ
ncbi:MAG: hypothetical protein WBQ43_00380 [Terriglobales bacterium]